MRLADVTMPATTRERNDPGAIPSQPTDPGLVRGLPRANQQTRRSTPADPIKPRDLEPSQEGGSLGNDERVIPERYRCRASTLTRSSFLDPQTPFDFLFLILVVCSGPGVLVLLWFYFQDWRARRTTINTPG